MLFEMKLDNDFKFWPIIQRRLNGGGHYELFNILNIRDAYFLQMALVQQNRERLEKREG
jgi:hypothetical protein